MNYILYIIVAAFIVLDFVTGIIKAIKEKNFSSTVMRQGLYHKAGSIAVIVFGVLVDYAQGYVDTGISIPVKDILCSYIITMEIGSIFENVCAINPEIVPAKLQQYFEKLKKAKEESKANEEQAISESIETKEEEKVS